ncbi:LytR C-terminal domain-containing protein [Candidatus Uhrbacteria bacterium]|nr:LytR C-terminal domain-containing protein [Candidatus Uhrbacteria bacterium]
MIKRTSTRSSASKQAQNPIPAPQPPAPTPTSPPSAMRALPFVLALIVAVSGAGYFVHASSQKNEGLLQTSEIQVREGVDPKEVEQVIKRVRELVFTNEQELPAVATIEDVSVLRPQTPVLYRDAQNGDRVLLWQDLIVVFSTVRQRVLAVMPIVGNSASTANTQPPEQAQNTPVPETPTIEVRNGTPTAGLARVLSDQLKSMGFKVLTPTDAQNKGYTKTKIWVSTDKPFPETLKRLLEVTGGEVVNTLPAEGSTQADILIIVGA